ncbi:MAG: hypothetical protein ACRC54_01610 [Fusobacteriaceae bacterium]
MKSYNIRLEGKVLDEKNQASYYRLTNFSEMSQDETVEIIEEISKLSDDDLKIVKKRRIRI